MLPLARALLAAGHDVALATAAAWRTRAESEGFAFVRAGLDLEAAEARSAAFRATLRTIPIPERRPLQFTHRFATLEAPARVDDLRAAVAAWEPDLLVHESADLAAPLVAEESRLTSVNHSFGRMVPLACFARAAAETEPLWRAAGLEPQPYGGAFRGGYVDLWPPILEGETPPDGTHVHRLRPATVTPPDDAPPAWLDELPSRPTVYVTLGTIHNPLDVFRVLLDGLAELDCNVVATVGEQNDPAALEPLPRNARVERFVPQAHVLPRCRAVVSHGGSGSVLGALSHGLPMLLVPQGADQFDNAASCEAAGAAIVLLPDAATPAAIRSGVETLLADGASTRAAAHVAGAIRAMPPAEDVAAALVGG